MGLRPETPRLLSGLPGRLSTGLFARAKLARLGGGDVLFRAGAVDDGCYRVEDGLLKVTVVSGTGAKLAGPGPWRHDCYMKIAVRGQPESSLSLARELNGIAG